MERNEPIKVEKNHVGRTPVTKLPQIKKVTLWEGSSKIKRNTTCYDKSAIISSSDLKLIHLKLSPTPVPASTDGGPSENKYRFLSTAESAKASRIRKKTFSLKWFITLKPTWPPQPPPKSPESPGSMLSPSHLSPVLLSLPPTPELPSKAGAAAKTTECTLLQFPKIRPGVKITHEEASREPMDIESYYAVEKLKKFVGTKFGHNQLPIIYDKQYNVKMMKYGVELHQTMLFDKPSRVFCILNKDLLKAHYSCVEWKAVDISTVYNITDLEPDITKQCDVRKIAKLMKLKVWKLLPPWIEFDAAMLSPLRVQMMGSVVACKLALEKGWAINIGGGFGHHTTNIGGGLAVYDDVLVCLAIMSKSPEVKHILVINFDAYQCLNYKYVSYAAISCSVTIIDFYTESIHQPSYDADPHYSFPNTYVFYHEQKMIYQDVNAYISKITAIFNRLFGNPREDKPSLCIYVAGTSVLAENPYTTVSFTKKDVIVRDNAVFQLIHNVNKIPIAILLGGGYHQYDVETAAASVCQLCNSNM